jgi:hypothetical protein
MYDPYMIADISIYLISLSCLALINISNEYGEYEEYEAENHQRITRCYIR